MALCKPCRLFFQSVFQYPTDAMIMQGSSKAGCKLLQALAGRKKQTARRKLKAVSFILL